jgi:predicted HicB family RNase H-like nuclease
MSALKAGRPTGRKEKAIAAVKGCNDIIKMNVNIPKVLHKKMKQKALDEDTTVTELVIKALNEVVSK